MTDKKEEEEKKPHITNEDRPDPVAKGVKAALEPFSKPATAEEPKGKSGEILKKIQAILNENGGLEGQIPLNSEYWDLQNQYRAAVAKGE